ncbi:MAG: hypothetical protein P4L71_19675 [Acetobacteraceae bacterium]|nr:hypothetical protein [Acetobacteraceae bacterium]
MPSADTPTAQYAVRVVLLGITGAALLTGLLRHWIRTARRRPARTALPAERTPSGAPIALQPLIQAVLRQVEQAAAMRLVEVQLAIQDGLTAVVLPDIVRPALAATVAGAINRAPAGLVLVSAERRGGSIEIAIQDDGAVTDRRAIEATLAPVCQALALQGGTLTVFGDAGQGTTVVLRLPQSPPRAPPPIWVRQRQTEVETAADRTH